MLALKSGGVIAWGDSTSGATNVPMYAQSGISSISAGWWSALALTTQGTMIGWGEKYSTNSSAYQNSAKTVDGINAMVISDPKKALKVVGIADGYHQGMCLLSDGSVHAFGASFTTSQDAQSDIPKGLSNIVAISMGRDFALALLASGTVVAWGDNSLHQCDVPKGLKDVISISAGGFHSLALKKDGTVVAWGDNSLHQCDVPLLTGVTAVEAGRYHSMASTEGVGDCQATGGGSSGGGGGGRTASPRTTSSRSSGISANGVGGSVGGGSNGSPRSASTRSASVRQ